MRAHVHIEKIMLRFFVQECALLHVTARASVIHIILFPWYFYIVLLGKKHIALICRTVLENACLGSGQDGQSDSNGIPQHQTKRENHPARTSQQKKRKLNQQLLIWIN